MANDLLNELNRNLKSAEEVGDEEWAKRLKARISKLEKAAKAESEEVPAAESPPAKPSSVSKKI